MFRHFMFDSEKALQAVAFLLRHERGHRMNYMRLLKLLYLADRESLAESGKPIAGGRVVAMQRGPVLEDVFSIIRDKHPETAKWSAFIQRDHYHLEMISDPGVGRLSRYARDKLSEIAQRFENQDEWDMVEMSHQLPEWAKNNPGTSSKEIPLRDILDAVGRLADLDEIVQSASMDEAAAPTMKSAL